MRERIGADLARTTSRSTGCRRATELPERTASAAPASRGDYPTPVPEAVGARTKLALRARARAGMSADREPLTVRRGRRLARTPPTRSSTALRRAVASTRTPARRSATLGGFAGLVRRSARDRLLVAATDGVGTKLVLAARGRARCATAGVDLVAMCVNDVLTTGAEPALLPRLRRRRHDSTRSASPSWSRASPTAAAQAGCALLGGETAELPGHLRRRRARLRGLRASASSSATGSSTARASTSGDAVIGLAVEPASTRTASRSCGRAARARRPRADARPATCSRRRASTPATSAALRAAVRRARAWRTSPAAASPGNLPRVLPEGLGARRRRGAPGSAGRCSPGSPGWASSDEMRRVFNIGIGYVASCRRRGRRGARRVRGRRLRRRGTWATSSPATASRYPGALAPCGVGVLVSGRHEPAGADRRVHGRAATIAGVVLEQRRRVRARARARGRHRDRRLRARRPRRRPGRARPRDGRLARPRTTSSSSSAPATWAADDRLPRALPRRVRQPAPLAAARVSRARTRSRTPSPPACRETGVTVHLVDEVLDAGPIVAQEPRAGPLR